MLNKRIMISIAVVFASMAFSSGSVFANMKLCEDIAEAKEADSLNLYKELTSESQDAEIREWDLALIQATVLLNSGFIIPMSSEETEEEFFANDGVVSYYKFIAADGKNKEVVLVRYYLGDTPVGAAFKLFPSSSDITLDVEPIIEFIGTISDDELKCLSFLGN